MHPIVARNVREALPLGVAYLLQHGVREESRAGPVLVSPRPVTTVYTHPWERVLLSPVRDANPFFHLVEALWMLAGRNDSGLLDNYVRDFGARFAEPGVPPIIHGAYGHRWRHALGFDQLDHCVAVLRKDPTSRQAVIQMWDASDEPVTSSRIPMPGDTEDDLEDRVGSNDLRGSWKDRPCNTHVYLRVREDHTQEIIYQTNGRIVAFSQTRQVLDITVCCRSNDIIMGAYGANAVHFSVLQEYLAARIGVGVGVYYQVSNNFHAYEADLDRLKKRAHAAHEARHTGVTDGGGYNLSTFLSDNRDPPGIPLVMDPETFDRQVTYLINAYERLGEGPPDSAIHEAVGQLSNTFLAQVVWPMMVSHRFFKTKALVSAQDWAARVVAQDWKLAALEWVGRRWPK